MTRIRFRGLLGFIRLRFRGVGVSGFRGAGPGLGSGVEGLGLINIGVGILTGPLVIMP